MFIIQVYFSNLDNTQIFEFHLRANKRQYVSTYRLQLLNSDCCFIWCSAIMEIQHVNASFVIFSALKCFMYFIIYSSTIQTFQKFFSRESDSTIANVCSSVSPSEIKTPQPLRIKPICHYAYLLISQIPISHHANQLSCQTATMPPPTQPLCQLAIIPIPISHHHAYWPLYLSAICPAFATSKPFWLVSLLVPFCNFLRCKTSLFQQKVKLFITKSLFRTFIFTKFSFLFLNFSFNSRMLCHSLTSTL